MNSTLSGSSKIAAASARHMSVSKPCHTPWSSCDEKPGTPWLVPQIRRPRPRTVCSVSAAFAAVRANPSDSAASEKVRRTFQGVRAPAMDRPLRTSMSHRDDASETRDGPVNGYVASGRGIGCVPGQLQQGRRRAPVPRR